MIDALRRNPPKIRVGPPPTPPGAPGLKARRDLEWANTMGDKSKGCVSRRVGGLGEGQPCLVPPWDAAGVQIQPTDWTLGSPGFAQVHWGGETWSAWDYGDQLDLPQALCRSRGLTAYREQRQCLLKTTAAAIIAARTGLPPPPECVHEVAQELRAHHWNMAQEANEAADGNPARVSPGCHADALQTLVHDALGLDCSKDFRSLAAFPHTMHAELTLVVWRVSPTGGLALETLVGEAYGVQTGNIAHALVHRGHMRLLTPPGSTITANG
jgi:hypothetical protein